MYACVAEGSTYEESICNEGSVCGSDASFYKQTQGDHGAMFIAVISGTY